ncbi:putative gnat family [Botryosphaeria dothidea]|uniref:Gnat family n=1 Tax=Botryosphaeria dothidea TaxID=55169 RepID=A0A8H4IN55_9PEZI|nr:putative gnat family [Botryosphaeria dothidea]
MPLEIRPVEEADADTMVYITTAALGSSGVIRLKHDDPPHPAYMQRRRERVLNTLSKPTGRVLKVVDTDNNDEIIAIAHWEILDKGRSDEELKELEQPYEPIEEERERHGQVQRDFFNYLHRVRRELGKTPHYFLSLLVTHPNHYRRGAGSMLIRWGTEQADRAGLMCFLEASKAGRPLYKRHGFVVKEITTFDLTKYGGTGTDENTTMTRQPVKN